MDFFEFLIDFRSWVGKRIQFMDYQLSLINALKEDDQEIFDLLGKYTPSTDAQNGNWPNLRGLLGVGKGTFREEAIMSLQSTNYVEMFSILESTMQHVLVAAEMEAKGDLITDESLMDHSFYHTGLSQLLKKLDNYSDNLVLTKLDFSPPKEFNSSLKLYYDIRNCIMHTHGRVTKNRHCIQCKLGYSPGQVLDIKDYDPHSVKPLIFDLLGGWTRTAHN